MATSISFPSDLPIANRDGHGDSHEDVRSHVEMETGPKRRRRMMTIAPRIFDVSFDFTQSQFLGFERWFFESIRQGELPFDIQLLDDHDTLVWYTVNWVAAPAREVVGQYSDNWRVTGSLRAVSQSFPIRVAGTDQLRGVANLEVTNTGAILVPTVFRGLSSVTSDNTGYMPYEGWRGISTVSSDNSGRLDHYYLFGVSSVENTNSAEFDMGDPLFANVQLLLHAEDLTDSSSNGYDLTAVGGASPSTVQARFGTKSLLITSTQRYTLPDAALYIGAADFTIEGWIYPLSYPSVNGTIISSFLTGNRGIEVIMGSGGRIAFRASASAGGGDDSIYVATSVTGIAPLNAWSHFAVCGIGTQKTMYIGGLGGTTLTDTRTYNNGSGAQIGRNPDGVWEFDGYIDELRITVGAARYTADFTPPAAPFPDA